MKKNIIVVDDEKGIRLLLKEVFAQAGFNVYTYEYAEEAAKEMEEVEPDIALIDYWITGTRGDQFAESVREQGYDFPIILMSGMEKQELKQKIDSPALEDMIEKPFNITDVVQTVNQTLSKYTKITD